MIYRVRAIRPEQTNWVEVESDSPEEAAGEYQEQHDPPYCGFRRETKNKGMEVVRLCCVEVEGHGEMVTRQFRTGIYRRGCVKPHNVPSLGDIAKKLGWEHDPNELIADGWPLEEQYS
jgi:hypothetical protein